MTQPRPVPTDAHEITDPVVLVSLDQVDRVHVYLDAAGEYRWRRVAAGNFATIAGPQEGYADPAWAATMAQRCNAVPYLFTTDAVPGVTMLVQARA
jgi:hypothetical protein